MIEPYRNNHPPFRNYDSKANKSEVHSQDFQFLVCIVF